MRTSASVPICEISKTGGVNDKISDFSAQIVECERVSTTP